MPRPPRRPGLAARGAVLRRAPPDRQPLLRTLHSSTSSTTSTSRHRAGVRVRRRSRWPRRATRLRARPSADAEGARRQPAQRRAGRSSSASSTTCARARPRHAAAVLRAGGAPARRPAAVAPLRRLRAPARRRPPRPTSCGGARRSSATASCARGGGRGRRDGARHARDGPRRSAGRWRSRTRRVGDRRRTRQGRAVKRRPRRWGPQVAWGCASAGRGAPWPADRRPGGDGGVHRLDPQCGRPPVPRRESLACKELALAGDRARDGGVVRTCGTSRSRDERPLPGKPSSRCREGPMNDGRRRSAPPSGRRRALARPRELTGPGRPRRRGAGAEGRSGGPQSPLKRRPGPTDNPDVSWPAGDSAGHGPKERPQSSVPPRGPASPPVQPAVSGRVPHRVPERAGGSPGEAPQAPALRCRQLLAGSSCPGAGTRAQEGPATRE